ADLKTVAKSGGFKGSEGSLLACHRADVKAGWVLMVGMGKSNELGLEGIRKAAARSAKKARAMDASKVLVAMAPTDAVIIDDESFARCWAEGAEMAVSPIGILKTDKGKKTPSPTAWTLLADAGRAKALQRGLQEADAYVAGCLFARDLVNLPPNILTPIELSKRAKKMAQSEGLSCTILNVPQMKKLNMGGILGVGQGSRQEPRLISLRYKAPRAKGKKVPSFALVGKGITFDTGGISLKPGADMDLMKSDMGGSAAVLGAILTAARLKLPVDIHVVVPTAENMPDGLAIKPADVLTMANGKTVEVLNTDAEGRLVLADGLWYASRDKPDHIIDAATLTGACVIALGSHFAGVMGNSGVLMDALSQAGGETHERVWPLPLVDEFKDEVKGTWGDLKNLGNGREAGAQTAAAFLSFFVDEKSSWAHVDIAGPSYTTSGQVTCPKGGTGFGARLIARTVQILAS
ncbi:MAG: leucyl aminopeptidase, partial [Candidatus Krumholzibacteriia bacterium]